MANVLEVLTCDYEHTQELADDLEGFLLRVIGGDLSENPKGIRRRQRALIKKYSAFADKLKKALSGEAVDRIITTYSDCTDLNQSTAQLEYDAADILYGNLLLPTEEDLIRIMEEDLVLGPAVAEQLIDEAKQLTDGKIRKVNQLLPLLDYPYATQFAIKNMAKGLFNEK